MLHQVLRADMMSQRERASEDELFARVDVERVGQKLQQRLKMHSVSGTDDTDGSRGGEK